MGELDHKEVWELKNWCFWNVVLEKTLESPVDSKGSKPVTPKGNQPWLFIGRTNAEAPILWPRDTKSWLIGKDPDAGKEWRQKEKGWQKMRWLGSIPNSLDMNLSQLWEMESALLKSMGSQRVGHDLGTKQQQNMLLWQIKEDPRLFLQGSVCGVGILGEHAEFCFRGSTLATVERLYLLGMVLAASDRELEPQWLQQ